MVPSLTCAARMVMLVCYFSQVVEENKNRFYGAPKYGGWILDNFPTTRELWMALVDKGILPDLVICLLDTGNNGWQIFIISI